jgi:hypothetical protein
MCFPVTAKNEDGEAASWTSATGNDCAKMCKVSTIVWILTPHELLSTAFSKQLEMLEYAEENALQGPATAQHSL